MPTVYSVQVTTGFQTDLDQIAVEIDAPANKEIKIKKIRIMHDDGTGTTTADYHTRVKLVRESAAGSGGASYTPIPIDANAPAATSTVNINSGSFLPGTISNTIDTISLHSGTDFFWQAESEDDKIVVAASGIFAVVLNPAA